MWAELLSRAKDSQHKGIRLVSKMVCHARVSVPLYEAVCLLEHSVFDETPLLLRVKFPGEHSEKERAKVYVIELEYALLLKKLNVDTDLAHGNHLLLRIPCSVQIRVAENGTGENIRNVLLHSSLLPDTQDLLQQFRHRIRLTECDEAGSNLRGERLLSAARGHQFQLLTVICTAHKVHAAAKKTMSLPLYLPLCSGIINTLKVLWDRKHVKAWKEELRTHIRSTLVILHRDAVVLPHAARVFRSEALELFAPSRDHPRLQALSHYIAESLLNGDWRKKELQHLCIGKQCCNSEEETFSKVERHVLRLARGLKKSMFTRDNWKDWPAQLRFFGLLTSMHSMLTPPMLRALQPSRANAQDQVDQQPLPVAIALHDGIAPAEPHPLLDPVDVERTVRAQRLIACCEWLESEWDRSLWLMRMCLRPQVRLMQATLHKDSQRHLAANLCEQLQHGRRAYNILDLHRASDTNKMLEDTVVLLHNRFCLALKLECFPEGSTTLNKDKPGRGTTFSTERIHSKNRRRAFGRVQTTSMDAATLSLHLSGIANPKWWHLPEAEKVTRRQGRPAKREAADQSCGGQYKKRRGGGGPWRAFLHVKAAGKQLSSLLPL